MYHRHCLGLWLLALGQGILLYPLLVQPLWAQRIGSPLISNHEPSDYKGHPRVWAALQDGRGVMYFAASSGLLEFDGQNWRTIPVVGDAVTRCLALAKDGTIFYGGDGDFGYLAQDRRGSIKTVSLKDRIPTAYQGSSNVWRILPTAQGVYVLCKNRVFRVQDGAVYVVSGKMGNCHPCVMNETVFYVDQDKGLCLLRGNESLAIPGGRRWTGGERLNLAHHLPPLGHKLLLLGGDGVIRSLDLASLWDERLARYDPARFDLARPGLERLARIEPRPFSRESIKLLRWPTSHSFNNLNVLKDGSIAIGTAQHGLILMDPKGRILRRYTTSDGLIDDSVLDVCMDQAENLWVATDNGISYIEARSPVSVIGESGGLASTVLSVAEYNGELYFGTFHGVYSLPVFDPLKAHGSRLQSFKNDIYEVWDLKVVDGALMAATGQSGLVEIHSRRVIPMGPRHQNGYCLIRPDKPGNLLLMGTSNGILRYEKRPARARRTSSRKANPRRAHYWRVMGRVEALEDSIQNFAQDSKGAIWASTSANGLIRLLFREGKMVVERAGMANGLPGLENMRVFANGDFVYAATPKGVFHCDIRGMSRLANARFTPEESFGKPFAGLQVPVRYLWFQNPSTVWISSDLGVYSSVVDEKGGRVFSSLPFRGLAPSDGRIFFTKDGHCILTGKPAYAVDLSKENRAGRPFKTLIRRIASNGGIFFHGTHALPEATIGRHKTLFNAGQIKPKVLAYPQNSLIFEFAAPSYERPGSTQFQYWLEGAETAYGEWTRNPKKEYTFLREGNYVFHVRSRDLYGAEGEEAAYAFRVLPPWYRTLPAFALWALMLWGAVYFFIQYMTLRLRRQRLVLEQRVAQRTEELRIAKEEAEKAKDEAERASAFKSAFIANTSHELRTPLNAILGFMRILVGGNVGEQDRNKFCRIVLNASESLLQIVEDLLDLSKIEVGRLDVVPAPFEIRPLIEDVLGILGNRAKEKNIDILASVAPEVPITLEGDRNRIRQMVINLLGNSIKFTHKGRVAVAVSGVPEGGAWMIRVTVEDTGLGIQPEVLPRLFTAFSQGDSDAKRMGTGLGLSITKQLAELMGGSVGAESSPGQGSRFWFTFRARALEAESGGGLELTKASSGKAEIEPAEIFKLCASGKCSGRILFADDNPSNRMLMGAILSQLGLEYVLVEDGVEALERFQAEPFDMVILDGRMPRMEGTETLQAIRRMPKGSAVPIVLFTAASGQQNQEDARRRGFDDVLKKPVDMGNIRDVVIDRLKHLNRLSREASGTLLNEARLRALSHALGGAEGLVDFLEAVLIDTPQRMERIHQALVDEDREKLSREAHDLKSNAASSGMSQLARLAESLETGALEAEREQLKAWVHELSRNMPQALDALKRWMEKG